jgi:hypothetical protein
MLIAVPGGRCPPSGRRPSPAPRGVDGAAVELPEAVGQGRVRLARVAGRCVGGGLCRGLGLGALRRVVGGHRSVVLPRVGRAGPARALCGDLSTRADGGAWPQRPASRQFRPAARSQNAPSSSASALPAACAAPTCPTLVVCPGGRPWSCPPGQGWPRATVGPFSRPGRKGPRAVSVPGGAVPGGALAARRHPVGGRPVTTLSEHPAVQGRRLPATIRAYVALTKPKLVELLLVTTVPAMMLAAGAGPRGACCWPPCSGGPWPPGPPTRSTAGTTATSTG